ncbi:tyrosine kinase receptor Cad96Ca-like [Orbicella faveolata]|uniref:tyrosine kinase receptor Cad96Ca-like n=1 Tax=Orbicella faveolata TaxID=48498 RepID=UPI0009E28FB6|nr:tyrosine kinase receptor Cad96Ca-like [Orbicella faveolata]
MLPVSENQNHDDVIWDVFELDREQITLVRILGTGNFGQVSKATYGDSRLEVAVKSLKETAQQKDIQDMLTELEVMKSMQPHPHVVRLIGCCTEKDPLLIVLEYLPYGDLLGYLRKSRGHEDTYNTGEKRPNSRLTEKELLSFAWMIADGMSYLATMKVNHGSG